MQPPWIPEAQAFLAKQAGFAEVMKRHAEVPLASMKRVDLFASLTHAIVNQQISGYAADAIHGRLVGLFPRKRLDPELLLSFSEDQLRKVGLSFNKIKFLKDLAGRSVRKELPNREELQSLSDEELTERLTAVHGIGPWTVQMLLIFKLGRPDVFPSSDLGVQKGFQRLFRRRERPTPKFLDRYAVRWKPYRTLAAWYLWRASDDVAFNPVDGGKLWKKSKSA